LALNASRPWLITYDIADKRRLSRLHRFIKKHAVPVQYSVFLFEGSGAQVGRLMNEIEGYIDPKYDDVRAYQLPVESELVTLGRGSLPESLTLTSARNPLLDSLIHARQT
jgi:CRISPR-associated protein Cas2